MSELLAYGAGVLLSLFFSYVPGASDWYAGLSGAHKRLVMVGALLGATVVVAVAQCFGIYDFGFASACAAGGWREFVVAFVQALIANQATYNVSPKRKGG